MATDTLVKSITPVLGLFQKTGVELDGFEEAVFSHDPQDLTNERNNALAQVAASMQKLSAQEQHAFLKSLANVSAEFLNRMNEAELYKTKITNENIESLKRFMDYVCNTQTVKPFHIDLDRTLRAYFRNAAHKTQERAARMREAIGTHDLTAADEIGDGAIRALDNEASNAMFDPIKIIGILLSSRIYRDYMAAIDNHLRPHLEYHNTAVPADKEPLRQLNQMKYGSNLAPGAPVAAQQAAPVNRPGGPGNM